MNSCPGCYFALQMSFITVICSLHMMGGRMPALHSWGWARNSFQTIWGRGVWDCSSLSPCCVQHHPQSFAAILLPPAIPTSEADSNSSSWSRAENYAAIPGALNALRCTVLRETCLAACLQNCSLQFLLVIFLPWIFLLCPTLFHVSINVHSIKGKSRAVMSCLYLPIQGI